MWIIQQDLGGMGNTVLAKEGSRGSRIRGGRTGRIPVEETRCEEVQVQNARCALSRKHALWHKTRKRRLDNLQDIANRKTDPFRQST